MANHLDVSDELFTELHALHDRVAELEQREAERLHTEEVRWRSEERLQYALDSTEDGLWDWDITTGALFTSRRWSTMLGYEPGEIAPFISGWEPLCHPDDLAAVKRHLDDHFAGRSSGYEFEHRLKHKNGTWVWVLGRAKVVKRDKYGRALRIVGTNIDITARKQAEQALHELTEDLEQRVQERTAELEITHATLQANEIQLRAFFGSAPLRMGIVEMIEDDVRFLRVNTRFADDFGVRPDTIQGQCASDFNATPDTLAIWLAHYQQAWQTQEPVRFEVYEPGPAGMRWLAVTVAPLDDPTVNKARCCFVTEDITERKRLADELQQFNQSLEQRVAERTAELEAANARLAQELAERKRAEEALHNTTTLLDGLFQHAPLAMQIFDRDGYSLRMNESNRRLIGAPDVSYGVGQFNLLTDPFMIANGTAPYFAQAYAGEVVHLPGFSVSFTDPSNTWTSDRETVYFDQILFPIHNQEHQLEAVVSCAMDITDRKQIEAEIQRLNSELEHLVELRTAQLQTAVHELEHEVIERRRAEQAVRASEARLRTILEEMPIMLDALDAEGNFVVWNRECERVTGYSAEEIIGNPQAVATLYPDANYRENLFAEWAQRGNDFRNWEMDLVAKDGTTRTVAWSNITDRFPISGWHSWSVGVDVTEQRQVEQALHENRRYLQLITDQTPAIVYIFDLPGQRNIYANRELTEMLGYTVDEVQAMGATFAVQLLHPIDLARLPVIQAQVAALSDNDIFEWEYRVRDKSGTWRWIASRESVFVRDAAGRPAQLLGIALDISERKYAEEALQQLNEALEERVRERTDALVVANKELESFSYSVSHDLRTPLRAIDGFSQAVLEDYADKLDEQGRHYLQRICTSTQRMGHLIDDLLNLARVARADMRQGPVNLSTLAANIVDELRQTDATREVNFQIAPQIQVKGDEHLLRVALENLLANAWKFTAQHPRASIEFGAAEQDGKPVYFVRDDGAGFDMAYASKLFGAFQRLHSMQEFVGTGIGLATTQRIIHRHGGRVWAEGAIENGATFYFTLPG